MNHKTAQLDIDTIFRALSDRTRLRILNLLRGGELCVCDLVSILEVPQPTASRHLAYLRKAGLALTRKEGLWHYYRLTRARSKFHKKLLECIEASSQELPELAADTERLRLGQRSNCCD
jgi:ArsR family transcriptional regulator